MSPDPSRLTQTLAVVEELASISISERENSVQGVSVEQLMSTIGFFFSAAELYSNKKETDY